MDSGLPGNDGKDTGTGRVWSSGIRVSQSPMDSRLAGMTEEGVPARAVRTIIPASAGMTVRDPHFPMTAPASRGRAPRSPSRPGPRVSSAVGARRRLMESVAVNGIRREAASHRQRASRPGNDGDRALARPSRWRMSGWDHGRRCSAFAPPAACAQRAVASERLSLRSEDGSQPSQPGTRPSELGAGSSGAGCEEKAIAALTHPSATARSSR